MKKFILLIALIALSIRGVSAAVTFSQARADSSKPMAVLVYADWADGYQNALLQFRKIQKDFGNSYNYVELNITKREAKEYSDSFKIMPGLSYIMLYRNNCKISRLLEKSCASNYSCISSKMKTFAR